ncbi:MAG: PEGA domain-containing protein [Pseudomonadota bacterium]
MPRFGLWLQLACGPLFVCSTALAQPTSGARAHFAQGVEQAELGDFDSAAANFEEAYRLSPHYAVLYNLGQAYSAIGKSIEALRAFEMYLERGGQKVAPERQDEVRQLILMSKKRIGYVAFEIEPPEATLMIDGRAIDRASLRVPTSLIAGIHGVAMTLPGYQTFVGSVNVEPQKIVSLKMKLEPAPASAIPAPLDGVPIGQIAVDSALPEINVLLDGTAVERVGKEPFLAPVGRHRIRCQRDGYERLDLLVEIHEKGIARVHCDLTPARELRAAETGFVSFKIDQSNAEVLIDGRRIPSSIRLSAGLHAVRIRCLGFVDWTRTVTARPGFPETIVVQLTPTPEHALETARTANKRRTLAYVIGGTGIALLGTSAALYATNNGRYRNWAAHGDTGSPDLQTALSIQRQDDAALGVAVVGGVMLGYAVISWLSSR